MKKFLAGTALAVACLAPLSTAKAVTVCGGSIQLSFCGSVVVTAVPNGTGGTDVSITVVNVSGNPIYGGDPLAVFTAIGLTDVSNIGTLTDFKVQAADGTLYTIYWDFQDKSQIGGGSKIDLDILAHTDNGVHYGLSALCSPNAVTPDPIYTGGFGGCAVNSVTFSFTSSSGNFSFGDVFIKAQAPTGSIECDFAYPSGTSLSCNTTTVPEPASIVLVGTGLMALGRRASRWRRRNQNV